MTTWICHCNGVRFRHSRIVLQEFSILRRLVPAKVWRSGSTVGFVYSGVPAHGSLVMIIWEGGKVLEGEEVREWAHGEYVHTE